MKNTMTTYIDFDVLMAEVARAQGRATGGVVIKMVLQWELEPGDVRATHPSSGEEQTDMSADPLENDPVVGANPPVTGPDESATKAEAYAPTSRKDWRHTLDQFPNP